MKLPSLFLLACSTIAAGVAAQGPAHVVGMTRNLPLLRHQDPVNCQLLNQCGLAGMPNAAALPWFAGGTAWDPTRSGAWVTNGQWLAQYDDNCNVLCPPMPIPLAGVNAIVTGMEVVEGLNQLWMIDNGGALRFFSNTCPPAPLGICNTGLGGALTSVTTGIAVDEGKGIVFIAYPDMATGINRIVVSLIANPCQPVSQFALPQCFAAFGLVTGLCCDWGNNTLYATDGTTVVSMNYGWAPPNVLVGPVQCCPLAVVADTYIGLAVRPGRPTSMGQPCANGACAPCPMVHSIPNDSVLGNAQFRLDLDNVFGNSFAFCLIGAGPCTAPGVGGPPLCGPIYTLPYLGYLGANLVISPAICGGSTSFPLPLPLNPTLAGLTYSSQGLVLCVGPGGGLGFAMSNCLSWTLQGN